MNDPLIEILCELKKIRESLTNAANALRATYEKIEDPVGEQLGMFCGVWPPPPDKTPKLFWREGKPTELGYYVYMVQGQGPRRPLHFFELKRGSWQLCQDSETLYMGLVPLDSLLIEAYYGPIPNPISGYDLEGDDE